MGRTGRKKGISHELANFIQVEADKKPRGLMRVRRIQFDGYSNRFSTLERGYATERDAEVFVLPDFSSEDLLLPEDLDFPELDKFED
jgi:hypothetical protein